MNLRTLKPSTGHDWIMVALGAALALLVVLIVTPRYEVKPTGYGLNFLRVDRWAGGVSLCATSCHPVKDAPTAD